MVNLLDFGIGILALSTGVQLLVSPCRVQQKRQRRWAKRIAELNEGASERYFEERRALTSYPPGQIGAGWMRALGLLVVIASIAMLAHGLSG